MARLFIANASTQNQIISYRLDYAPDGTKDVRTLIPYKQTPPIPPGRQMPVGGDMHLSQIDSILGQLRTYGLVAEIDVARLPRGQKVTYISSVGQPVREETIRVVNDHNRGVKVQDGMIRRKKAAIAASAIVEHAVTEATPPGAPPAPMSEFDLGFEQEEQSENGERRIEEGYIVDPSAPVAPTEAPKQPGRRGRPRKAA